MTITFGFPDRRFPQTVAVDLGRLALSVYWPYGGKICIQNRWFARQVQGTTTDNLGHFNEKREGSAKTGLGVLQI